MPAFNGVTFDNILPHIQVKSENGNNGCIWWKGIIGSDGYPVLNVGGKQYRVSRLLCLIYHGLVFSSGYSALHKCGNKSCVNQEHLYVGTQAENNRDTVKHGHNVNSKKTHCLHGHEYTPQNTKILRNGSRQCIMCKWLWAKTQSHRKN